MNKIVVIANKRFEAGLVAFINSYIKANMKTPLVIIDTGLQYSYPFETIKKDPSIFNTQRASWMTDSSPYFQLNLGDIEADKILYMEVDMLILKNIDDLFYKISLDEWQVMSVMDDAALASTKEFHVDSAGRYFVDGSFQRKRYRNFKGYNGGLVGGSRAFYKYIERMFSIYLSNYEKDYRLLAQSLLNQFIIEENILVYDPGLLYNFSGINEYYDHPEWYKINKNDDGYSLSFLGNKISVVHFTGKNKPFLSDEKNILTPLWDYYYNEGRLF